MNPADSMSVQRNFLFSGLLTVANYIFPFIVYPYVAHVLGVNNIGIVNFADSIVNYAMLISTMGITIVGTRSIAKAKSDPQLLNEAFSSLFVICAGFTLIASAALVTVTYTVEAMQPYKPLLLIGLIKLWGNFFLIEWLYKGLEDFRYITLRTIFVKIGFVACVFSFIHHAYDYSTYFLLMCLSVAVNAAFNCYRATRLLKFSVKLDYIKANIGSILILGVYLLLNSMYTTFNVTYLGLEWNDVEVGYYTTATKVFKLILALYTAYSVVVLPRASSLLSEGKIDEFKSLITKSVQGLVLFSVPIGLFAMLFSPGIIDVIGGEQYDGAIVPMIIVMPLIFIIGYEQILVVQVLTPLASDKVILLNSIIGATVGVVANLLLVPKMASVGSAVVWVIAEVAVLLTAQHFVTQRIGMRFPMAMLCKNVCAYLPYVAVCLGVAYMLRCQPIVAMVIGGVITVVYAAAVQQLVLKNPIYSYIVDRYLRRGKATHKQ